MKTRFILMVSLLAAAIFQGRCIASTVGTFLIYKPINMEHEGTAIHLPENGYIIVAVPYVCSLNLVEKPYYAIAIPYVMSSSRRQEGEPNSNIAAQRGIVIGSECTYEGDKFKEEVVTVDFSKFDGEGLEIVAEATLECIRRMATDEHQNWSRPKLKIIGKPEDKAMWRRWEQVFNTQDFNMPFSRSLEQGLYHAAPVVIRAWVDSQGEGSKYLWAEVHKDATVKAPGDSKIPDHFKVACQSGGQGLPIGRFVTLYLELYNPDKPDLGWKLVERYDPKTKKFSKGYTDNSGPTEAEKPGADQPAASDELKLDDTDQSKPEAEGRPR